MKRKRICMILCSVFTAALILGGCGQPRETMGSAAEAGQEESKGAEEAAQPEESVASGETVQEEEKQPEAVILAVTSVKTNPDGKHFGGTSRCEYEYDVLGNMIKETYFADGSQTCSYCRQQFPDQRIFR